MRTDDLIGTLKLELRLSSEGSLKGCDARMDSLTDSAVIPVLERLSEAYSGQDIFLDSIEVDLGKIAEENFASRLEKELRAILNAAVRTAVPMEEVTGERHSGRPTTAGVQEETPHGSIRQAALSPDAAARYQDAILEHYLESSRIQWTEDTSRFDTLPLMREVFLDQAAARRFINSLSKRGLEGLFWLLDALIPPYGSARDSVSEQDAGFSAGQALEMVAIRLSRDFPGLSARLERRRTIWRRIGETPEDGTGQKVQAISARMASNSDNQTRGPHHPVFNDRQDGFEGNPGPRAGIPEGAVRAIPENVKKAPEADSGRFDSHAGRTTQIPASHKDSESPSAPQHHSGTEAVLQKGLEPSVTASFKPHTAPSSSSTQAHDDFPEDAWRDEPGLPWTSPAIDTAETGQIPYADLGRLFIDDAGLVIAHPFLRHLFRNLELLDHKNQFVSSLARIRAAHLLRQVTGARGDHYDHRMVLEKVLCGIPPMVRIPVKWDPSERELREVHDMLEALKSYWPPLSRSGVEALRKAFILRAGSLETTEGGYLVRVEGSAMDILLDELPWETSMIVLPWQEKTVLVEWQR